MSFSVDLADKYSKKLATLDLFYSSDLKGNLGKYLNVLSTHRGRH
jgi:hypothetical protein